MPQYSKVTIYNDDDITPMVSVSTDPSSDKLPHTNLSPYSERLDSWAPRGAATVTSNAALAPNGRLEADRFNPAAASGYIGTPVIQANDINGRTFTVSVWLQAIDANPKSVTFGIIKNGDVSVGISTTIPISQVPKRYSFTATANVASTSWYSYLQEASGNAIGFYVWGFDVKEQATLTDYIPTPGAVPVTMPGVYPYLQDDSLVYGESKINFPEGSAGIGQFGFKVLDKRLTATDQTTGFFTALLADAGGRGNILGHRVVWERQQLGGYDAYITQFDGIIDDCKLDDTLVEYNIPCRDVRERERTNRIFTKHNQTTSLVPNGPVNGWGRNLGIPSITGLGQMLIPPVTPLIGKFWRDPNMPLVAGRIKAQKTQFDLIITGSRYQVLQQYGALTQASGLTGGDTSLAFRNVIVWWRPYPGGGAWHVMQNMPAVDGTDYPMSNIFPLGQGTFEGAENRSFVPKGPKDLVNFLVNMTGTNATLPAHQQDVEFMVLANGQPTEEAPIYWEGNLGQLTKDIYDGVWSNYAPGVRYDAAAMTNFITKSVRGAALITAPVENGLQWAQENTYKPQGWVPSVPPETGLVTPIQYNLPNATEPLINLTDSLVKEDAKWELAKDELINEVNFQYDAMFIRDSKYITNFADKLGINANLVEPPAQRIGTFPVYYPELNIASQALLGAKVLSYKPETIKLFGVLTPNGLDTKMWPDVGAKLARDRTKEVLDRFTFAGQRLTVNARRSDAGVAGAKMGNWALCGISWLPDYVSKKRGLNRIMQIVSVNDDDKVFRKFVLSDAGPNAVPSGQPVLGAITQANGVIDIAFTSIPAGIRANVDFAFSTLEPPADSGLWVSAGRTTVATDHITLGPLPPGTSVWLRAVGEEPGKRRSAFTASQNIIISAIVGALTQQVTFDSDGHARVSWGVAAGTGGVRIFYAVHDATVDPPALTLFLDADASLGQVQLPVIPNLGEAITVKITGYPGFAAGAVTGAAGYTTDSMTVKNQMLLPVGVVVEPQTSETSSVATLTLNVIDMMGRVTKVEFMTQAGNNSPSAWVQDSVLPYATSVALVEKQVSRIWYRVTGIDDNNILKVLAEDVVTFTAGAVPLPPVIQSISFDAAGNMTVLVTGDPDTQSFSAFAQINTDPTLTQIRGAAYINGRVAGFVFGPYAEGDDVHVGVLAYSLTAKAGLESQGVFGKQRRVTTGPTGVQGIQGPSGVQGPQGAIGVTGAQGPQGPIGVTGAVGPAGPTGVQGVQGIQGPVGITGAVGPTGVAGPTGSVGPTGLVGANWRGVWLTTYTYDHNDIVQSGTGVSYIASGGVRAQKTGGTGGTWTQQVYSAAGLTGAAYAAAKGPSSGVVDAMFGLNTDPTTDDSYASIDYALYLTGGNLVIEYNNGVAGSNIATWAAGDFFEVIYVGTLITYKKNGIVIGTRAVAAGLTLYFDSSFYQTNAALRDLRFGASYATSQSLASIFTASAGMTLTDNLNQTPGSSPDFWDLVSDKGVTGAIGPTGAVGPTGVQGPTGLQGPQGVQGAVGVTGAAGPQGPTGVQGPQGTQGPTGVQGPQGIQGVQGTQGAAGSVGPTGAVGPTGPSIAAARGKWHKFANTSIVNAGVGGSVPMDTADYDPNGLMTSLPLANFTVQAGQGPADGIWMVHGFVRWASNATGVRQLLLLDNGSTMMSEVLMAGVAAASSFDGTVSGPMMEVFGMAAVTVGHSIGMLAWQNSGAALNITLASLEAIFIKN